MKKMPSFIQIHKFGPKHVFFLIIIVIPLEPSLYHRPTFFVEDLVKV